MEEEEPKYIRGLVVNKFRGDAQLFSDGVRILEQRSGLPVLGVVPFIKNLNIADEDATVLDQVSYDDTNEVDITVIHLPHISNFDDFDPLRFEPAVNLRFVNRLELLGRPNVIILPGSKNTIGDLVWLRKIGFAAAIQRMAKNGVAVVGICGGYQMMGKNVQDDHQI